jgi:hypothetical protein
MLSNPDAVQIVDFDAWFATDSPSKLYEIMTFAAHERKQAEAFDRLTKMHIVREHKGTLHLNETFREQYKSALTGR